MHQNLYFPLFLHEPALSHLGPDVEVVHSSGAHEGDLHVRVRVDPSRDHQPVGRIDHSRSGRDPQIGPDLHYFTSSDVNVAEGGAVLVHHLPSCNKDPAGFCHYCQQREQIWESVRNQGSAPKFTLEWGWGVELEPPLSLCYSWE